MRQASRRRIIARWLVLLGYAGRPPVDCHSKQPGTVAGRCGGRDEAGRFSAARLFSEPAGWRAEAVRAPVARKHLSIV